jgi:hypothetical protein
MHFGCTVISTAALKRTPKPWFLGKPNDDGEWGEGRRDDDIYFWENFRKAGNRCYVSASRDSRPRRVHGHVAGRAAAAAGLPARDRLRNAHAATGRRLKVER